MEKVIDGKGVAQQVKDEIKAEVEQLKRKDIQVRLVVVIVGNDSASRVYVNNKRKACEYVGFISDEFALPENTTQEQLLNLIYELNNDESVNGILCQLPLPKHIDEEEIINAISPLKDVDAFHPVNVGKIMIGNYDFLPCTPAGIMEIFKFEGIEIEGKDCVILGRSNIVGKPMSMLMLQKNATVTICHSKTKDLAQKTSRADILIAAIGKAKFVKSEMVKNGAIVIDVGINRDENGKLCGDVDFDSVLPKVSSITPVPGGVGPMTIATLMKNTLKAAKIQNKI